MMSYQNLQTGVLTTATPPMFLMINAVVWNIRGLNRRDHHAAVSDVISEFNLHFIGLLETRVSAHNVTCVQSFLSHYWKWFVDYMGPGTRIWLAWKHDEVDVEILSVHTQIVHFRILIRRLHEHILVSVVCGPNDVYERRELWRSLVQLADCISDEP
ncbi:UNVERIFIED_CONTAM: hypothetical protein Slati_1515200 [Sesamum latifolium]|uniref:Uncharacterized protein n=1 Tax=Sesamum latifolium TaxID=2727402 RepID=A0AAW2X728_9LAMI